MYSGNKNIKCISPIIATALLLVVAVVAVVGFSFWFEDYSSKISSNVETYSSQKGSSVNIEAVVGDSLYIKNSGDNVTVKNVKVNGFDCLNNDTVYQEGFFEINISLCIDNLNVSNPDVLIVTDKGLVEKKIYVKNVVNSVSYDCVLNGQTILNGSSSVFYKYDKPYNSVSGCSVMSQERTCNNGNLNGTSDYTYTECNDSLAPSQGGEWLLVLGNDDLGTEDFYVMKYEAKFANIASKTFDEASGVWQYDNAGGDLSITSGPLNEPIAYISQEQAGLACSLLGDGYKLINRSEWVTIGREIENIAYNWDSGQVYSGKLYTGHSDRGPSYALPVSDVDDGYVGTGNSALSGIDQRRTLKLRSDELIWDLSGNLWEWNSDVFETNEESSLGTSPIDWMQWTEIDSSYDYLKPYNTSLTSTNGIGRVKPTSSNAIPSGTVHAFASGGDWNRVSDTGFFALFLGYSPTISMFMSDTTFRCTYNP